MPEGAEVPTTDDPAFSLPLLVELDLVVVSRRGRERVVVSIQALELDKEEDEADESGSDPHQGPDNNPAAGGTDPRTPDADDRHERDSGHHPPTPDASEGGESSELAYDSKSCKGSDYLFKTIFVCGGCKIHGSFQCSYYIYPFNNTRPN